MSGLSPYLRIVIVSWLVFLTYWLMMAPSALRTLKLKHAWTKGMWFRLAMVVVVLLLVRSQVFDRISALSAMGPGLSAVGDILCVAGLAFAIWARMHIGSLWAMPMGEKTTPGLVTSGPYAYVRHPIYGGVMIAMLGSSIIAIGWLVIFACFVGWFVFSASREEALKTKEFPEAYPAYMRRTKRFIPFVW